MQADIAGTQGAIKESAGIAFEQMASQIDRHDIAAAPNPASKEIIDIPASHKLLKNTSTFKAKKLRCSLATGPSSLGVAGCQVDRTVSPIS